MCWHHGIFPYSLCILPIRGWLLVVPAEQLWGCAAQRPHEMCGGWRSSLGLSDPESAALPLPHLCPLNDEPRWRTSYGKTCKQTNKTTRKMRPDIMERKQIKYARQKSYTFLNSFYIQCNFS